MRRHGKAIADGIGGGKIMPMVEPVYGIVKGQILGHLDYPINYEFVQKVKSFCVIYINTKAGIRRPWQNYIWSGQLWNPPPFILART